MSRARLVRVLALIRLLSVKAESKRPNKRIYFESREGKKAKCAEKTVGGQEQGREKKTRERKLNKRLTYATATLHLSHFYTC